VRELPRGGAEDPLLSSPQSRVEIKSLLRSHFYFTFQRPQAEGLPRVSCCLGVWPPSSKWEYFHLLKQFVDGAEGSARGNVQYSTYNTVRSCG
jgi:hypothetical protein